MLSNKKRALRGTCCVLIRQTLVLALFVCLPSFARAEGNVWFDFNFDARSFADSTRCDWSEYAYNTATTTPDILKKQYDEVFMGSKGHLYTAMRTNIGEKSFLDLSNSLFYAYYDREDPFLRDKDSFKYRSTDNNLRLKWGLAVNDCDYFLIDYQNNDIEIPAVKYCCLNADTIKARFAHKIAEKNELSLTGSFQRQKYDADRAFNYDEMAGKLEFASFMPANDKYEQIANSSRGEKSTFEKIPTGMHTLNAVDYYTDYVKNPLDTDPDAKYKITKKRGDLYLLAFGDFSSRDYKNLDISGDTIGGGFEAAYQAAQDITLRIDEAYKKTDFDTESNANFLYDRRHNSLEISLEHGITENLLQVLSYNNEIRKHEKQKNEDYTLNALYYNAFYGLKDACLSFGGGGLKKNYKNNRDFYPDTKEWFALAGFDYNVSETTRLKLKTELAKVTYENGESFFYSSCTRHTYRAGVEKSISKYNSLEAAFQINSEDHEKFSENNLEEKSFQLSWLLRY